MAFASIKTDHLDTRPFAEAMTKASAEKQRTKRAIAEMEITRQAIQLMGGDGDLAFDLVKNWIDSPYLSMLRWGVTRVIGESVTTEFKRIQMRGDAISQQRWENDISQILDLRVRAIIIAAGREPNIHRAKEVVAEMGGDANVLGYIRERFSAVSQRVRDRTEMARMVKDSASPRVISTIVAMAALSQSTFGRGELKLYRGICCEQGHGIYESIARSEGDAVRVGTDHATSFTDRWHTARNFAHGLGMSLEPTGPTKAIVVRVYPPVESLVASPTVFNKLLGENELIVATHGEIMVEKSHITVYD